MEVLASVGLVNRALRILWMAEGDLAMKAQMLGDRRNSSARCTLKIPRSLALLYLEMRCCGG